MAESNWSLQSRGLFAHSAHILHDEFHTRSVHGSRNNIQQFQRSVVSDETRGVYGQADVTIIYKNDPVSSFKLLEYLFDFSFS
jgi:hypothetical protein